MRPQNLSCFGFNFYQKKSTSDFIFGMFTLYLLDFTPVVGFLIHGQKFKLAFIDCFESASCPSSVFLMYRCHHSLNHFWIFKSSFHIGPIWLQSHCDLELFRVIENHMEAFGAFSSHLEPFGAFWSPLEPFGAIWKVFEPFGQIWSILSCLEQFGLIWKYLDRVREIWCHLWSHVEPSGAIWSNLLPFGAFFRHLE